jgi:ribose transport system permease protein
MFDFLRKYGTLIGFTAIISIFAWQLPDTFLSARNLMNISQQISMLLVVATTMTFVMVMNDFDLSVGSMASLAGVVAAVLFSMETNIFLSLIVAISVGFFGGLFNGFLVSYIGILPFVATLGTLTIFSGMAFIISGGKTIFGRDIPSEFSNFARDGFIIDFIFAIPIKIPFLTVTAFCILVICWIILEQSQFGRRLYAIGGNYEAAELAGVQVKKLRLIAFGLTGTGAAIAGLMYASRVASANPTQGSGLMLDAIAAVFLGMTMSAQGEPRVFNTFIGVLILGILDNGLTQMNVDSYVREVLVGCIVILAIGFAAISKNRFS